MSEKIEVEDNKYREHDHDEDQRPDGALLVVGVLTVTILSMWFLVFALNVVRG